MDGGLKTMALHASATATEMLSCRYGESAEAWFSRVMRGPLQPQLDLLTAFTP